MTSMTCRIVALVLATLLVTAAAPKPQFTATWKSPDAKAGAFAGKKVVGLIVSDDMSLRQSTEEALARAVTARGVEGIAAYRLIPKEEIRNPESAKGWFQRAGAAGVVVMRLVDVKKETVPSVSVWSGTTYYSSLWAYYPYAWAESYTVVSTRTDTTLVIETLLFDVTSGHLWWAGTSESTNPKNAQAVVTDIVDVAAEQMKKDGLIRGK